MNKYGIIKRPSPEPTVFLKIEKDSLIKPANVGVCLFNIEKIFIDYPKTLVENSMFVMLDRQIYEFEDDDAAKLFYEVKDYDE